MSYIIQGTGYPDPELSFLGMDFSDLRYIYKEKIGNYMITEQSVKNYFFTTEKIPVLNIVYPIETIYNLMCFHQHEQNVVSVIPLFFYFCCKTKNWTYTVDFSTTLSEYIDLVTLETTKSLKEVLENFSKDYTFNDFLGLKKFKEDYLKQSTIEENINKNSSLLEWFLVYWKNNCLLFNPLPNVTINRSMKTTLSEEEQQRYDNNYSFFKKHPEQYVVYTNGSVYDSVHKKWIVGRGDQ